MSIPIKPVRPYCCLRPARCKTFLDFNDTAKIGILILLCKLFYIFLPLFLAFSLFLANFVKENDRKCAYDVTFLDRIQDRVGTKR